MAIETDKLENVKAAPVTLNDCPPGLFMFGQCLGFKSEYMTTLENPRRYQVDAYVVASGEYFWGGAKNTEQRGKLIVQPIDCDALATDLNRANEIIAEKEAEIAELREEVDALWAALEEPSQ